MRLMRDWKLIAAGQGLNIPEGDLQKITQVLDGLEAAFRPLGASIPPEIEPAVTFSCPPQEKA